MGLNAFNAFHFIQPRWLLILPLLWLFTAWCVWRTRIDSRWSQVIDAELLPLLSLQTSRSDRAPWWLLNFIWLLTAVALAGPTWQREPSPAFSAPAAWIIVQDLSPSMSATDLAPDRATRSRYAIDDILNAAKDARVSLVVFAGEAHVVAPLTTDVATVRALLPPLSPSIMPESGDQLAPALDEVKRLIHSTATQHAQVLVLSDGISDPAQALQAAQQLRQQGASVDVIGIGTTTGAPQPNGSGGFVKDAQGRSVLSTLPVDQLQRIARAGGGNYVPISNLNAMITSLQSTNLTRLQQDQRRTDVELNTWRNAGVGLLLPLLLLVVLFARRGWL